MANRSTVPASARSTDASSVTSTVKAVAEGPNDASASTLREARRAPTATCAPASHSANATVRPRPLLAPVTNADLPLERERVAGHSRTLKERGGPDLDALPHWGISRRIGIVEGAVTDKTSTAVCLRVVRLEQDCLILGHAREVPPVVPRRMPQHEDFSVSVAVAQLHREKIVIRRRREVTHCKRLFFDGSPQRLPKIIKRNPALEEFVGLSRKELPYAQRARIRRVVTMHEHDRRALRGGVLIGLLLLVFFARIV